MPSREEVALLVLPYMLREQPSNPKAVEKAFNTADVFLAYPAYEDGLINKPKISKNFTWSEVFGSAIEPSFERYYIGVLAVQDLQQYRNEIGKPIALKWWDYDKSGFVRAGLTIDGVDEEWTTGV